jgi:hypothetical protein
MGWIVDACATKAMIALIAFKLIDGVGVQPVSLGTDPCQACSVIALVLNDEQRANLVGVVESIPFSVCLFIIAGTGHLSEAHRKRPKILTIPHSKKRNTLEYMK